MSAYYIVTLWVFEWDGSALCAGINVVVQLEFFFYLFYESLTSYSAIFLFSRILT